MTVAWSPTPRQREFMRRGEYEILFGGAAGPGKTDALVMLAAGNKVENPNYRALLLRRTFPQMQEILDRCRKYYPMIDSGAIYREKDHRWTFSSGATINLGHMQHETDKFNYHGHEYGFIGFDELTQFEESQYLYMFSRCRSVDPTIRPMIRCTSNPGGIGHEWVRDRFVTITEHEKTHIDPSTGFSRTFIPAKVTDNPYLMENDPDYILRLNLLPPHDRMRYLEGIWDTFEGQIFSELNREIHCVEPFDIPPEWHRYRSFDWGHSAPFSVGWWAVDFDGNIYRYREWYGAKKDEMRRKWVGMKMSAAEIARGIIDRERDEAQKGLKVHPGPADPSIWSRRIDPKSGVMGISVADEMIGEGVVWLKGDNDRILGKQQLHSRLAIDPETNKPSMYVFKTCEHWWRTIPLLREDPRLPEDVDHKEAEDHCLHGDTEVITSKGVFRISDLVGTSGQVRTVGGCWTPYHDCRLIKKQDPMIRVVFENGMEIVCTGDHKLLSSNGDWVEARNSLKHETRYVNISNLINGGSICKLLSSAQRFKNLMENGSTGAETIFNITENAFTEKFLNTTTGRFLKAIISTIGIKTGRTIRTITWNLEQALSTFLSMEGNAITPNGLVLCSKGQLSGMEARMVLNGIANTTNPSAKMRYSEGLRNSALLAEARSMVSHFKNSVQTTVNPSGVETTGSTLKSVPVRYAERSSQLTDTESSRLVQGLVAESQAEKNAVRAIRVEDAGTSDSFCLVADDSHAFAVNGGLIVSNCYDETRYMLMFRAMRPRMRVKEDINSFQYWRRKTIKAKSYAAQHGVSYEQAYGMVR